MKPTTDETHSIQLETRPPSARLERYLQLCAENNLQVCYPTTPAQFACLWGKEVADARALGRRVGPAWYHEVRYEDLVAAGSEAESGDTHEPSRASLGHIAA